MICVVLALGTLTLYWPITHHPFILFDDEAYIVSNNHVTPGLSGTNFVWAFTTSEQANWHPLTWLSHQTDCTLFGLDAGRHHLVNLLYHTANTLLLFLFLRRATGAVWRSAFVAALFAWHPLHVESVAWAAERKDVLSTFFWLLTLAAYLEYARGLSLSISPSSLRRWRPFIWYVLALIGCACGLMSKPMVVTLPCVLLLLDFWPLNRIELLRYRSAEPATFAIPPRSPGWLIMEKLPFFALVIAASLVTYLVQSGGGAVAKTSWPERLANAVLAYARYSAKLVCPTDLAIIYPHPRHWPVPLALGAVLMLAVWTFLCVYNWRRRPFLAAGWFWFLGTLVPTIGLIQVGAQSMADRYTYIPSIGFFIVVVWCAAEWAHTRPQGWIWAATAGAAALLVCGLLTSWQIALWSDGITLFKHAVDSTVDNYAAENVLGKAYEKAGDNLDALVYYQLSVQTESRFPESQFNLATCLLTMGQTDLGIEHLRDAAALEPGDPDIQFDLGVYFSLHRSWTNAIECYSNALVARPNFPRAEFNWGNALANAGEPAGAAQHFRKALQLDPQLGQARTNLDRVLRENPQLR